MEAIKVRITGTSPMLLNNPQTVDPFNEYKIAMKKITSKTRKTDEDLLKLRDIEVRAKLYWDDDTGIYIPSNWVIAAIGQNSNALCKIGKAKIRGAVTVMTDKIKLEFERDNLVKTPTDIVNNPFFRHLMIVKQGQVRIPKCAPIFHKWSFETVIETDPSIINIADIIHILTHSAKYGGFGDFRPTFGRAKVESSNV